MFVSLLIKDIRMMAVRSHRATISWKNMAKDIWHSQLC